MFNDFNFLNYWKAPKKLRKTRELINRLYGEYLTKLNHINTINTTLNRLDTIINKLELTTLPSDLELIHYGVVQLTYQPNSHLISISVTIKNTGKGKAKKSHFTVEMSDGWSKTIVIPELKINEEYTSLIIYHTVIDGDDYYVDEYIRATDYTITFVVDSLNELEELNEDNELTIPISIYTIYI